MTLNRKRICWLISCASYTAVLCCSLAVEGQTTEPGEFSKRVQPFLKQHCTKCHGEQKQEGDLRVDALPAEFGNSEIAARWSAIMDRLNAGEMPPKKEPRPPTEDTV